MLQIQSDFNYQWINLLFLIPPIVKAIIDSNLQKKKNKSPNHSRSILIFMGLGVVLAFIDFKVSPVEYYLQAAFLGITYFFLIFDYLRNFLVQKPLMYIDDAPESDPEEDSWVDTQIYSKLGSLGTLSLKLWVFILGNLVYYYFSIFG